MNKPIEDLILALNLLNSNISYEDKSNATVNYFIKNISDYQKDYMAEIVKIATEVKSFAETLNTYLNHN